MVTKLKLILSYLLLFPVMAGFAQKGNKAVADSTVIFITSDADCRLNIDKANYNIFKYKTEKILIRKGEHTLLCYDNYAGLVSKQTIRLKKNEKRILELKIAEIIKTEIQKTLGSFSQNMVLVQGGTFLMGCRTLHDSLCEEDEFPSHAVTLSSYYINKFEVTQKQWRVVMGGNPSSFIDCDDCPVEMVNWYFVGDFIKKLNELTGKKFRLPTEAEWEYAASGGISSAGYRYSGSNSLADVAWYWENSKKRTHPVGQRKANEIGLYDMSGNVWEWCNDWYDQDYYKHSPSNNPPGSEKGDYHIMRGGSWDFDPWDARVTNRGRYFLDRRVNIIGFRLAMDVK